MLYYAGSDLGLFQNGTQGVLGYRLQFSVSFFCLFPGQQGQLCHGINSDYVPILHNTRKTCKLRLPSFACFG